MHVRNIRCSARVMAWVSVHTVLSELSQTMCKRVTGLFRRAGLVQNGLVLLVYTHLLLANQTKSLSQTKQLRSREQGVSQWAHRGH